MSLPTGLKIDPNQFAGKSARFGDTSVTFGKGKHHGDVLIQKHSPSTRQMAEMITAQFRQVLRGDVPPVCGMCGHCKPIDYGRGATVPSCTHPITMKRRGKGVMVDPEQPPEVNTQLCPMIHEHMRVNRTVFEMTPLRARSTHKETR